MTWNQQISGQRLQLVPVKNSNALSLGEVSMSDSRPTVRVPPPEPSNQFAGLDCGVPGYEGLSARKYAMYIIGLVKEGNFGAAGDLIEKARRAGQLGLIRAAYTGKI
jgi:hypothetical protein